MRYTQATDVLTVRQSSLRRTGAIPDTPSDSSLDPVFTRRVFAGVRRSDADLDPLNDRKARWPPSRRPSCFSIPQSSFSLYPAERYRALHILYAFAGFPSVFIPTSAHSLECKHSVTPIAAVRGELHFRYVHNLSSLQRARGAYAREAQAASDTARAPLRSFLLLPKGTPRRSLGRPARL